MKTVSVDFTPGKGAKVTIAECQEVLAEIREADLSKAKVVYFGWMEPDGTYHIASHADGTLEAVGMMHMHIATITAGFLGIPRVDDLDGDDEEEEDADA